MSDDIRCRGGLNKVRDSEVTCGSVPQWVLHDPYCQISVQRIFRSAKFVSLDKIMSIWPSVRSVICRSA